MAKYSRKAEKTVASAMRRKKRGTLTSGRSGKKVTSRKQAIAIGISEARQKGMKVPAKRTAKKTSGKESAGQQRSGPRPREKEKFHIPEGSISFGRSGKDPRHRYFV